MKNTIIFLLLLCNLFAQAQTTTKSFVLSSDGINYLEVTRTTSEDGLSYTETAALVGSATALAADQADKIEQRMAALAAQAYAVSFSSRRIKEEAHADSAITALTTLSPLKVIQDRYQQKLLTAGWQIDQGAGFLPLVFTVSGQGVLRYSINGAATKVANMYGGILKLRSFPSGTTDTEFFLAEDGKRYFALPNRAVIIKKP